MSKPFPPTEPPLYRHFGASSIWYVSLFAWHCIPRYPTGQVLHWLESTNPPIKLNLPRQWFLNYRAYCKKDGKDLRPDGQLPLHKLAVSPTSLPNVPGGQSSHADAKFVAATATPNRPGGQRVHWSIDLRPSNSPNLPRGQLTQFFDGIFVNDVANIPAGHINTPFFHDEVMLEAMSATGRKLPLSIDRSAPPRDDISSLIWPKLRSDETLFANCEYEPKKESFWGYI